MKVKSFKTLIPCFDPVQNVMRQRWDSKEYDLSLHQYGILIHSVDQKTPNEQLCFLIPWHMIEGTIDVGNITPEDIKASPTGDSEGAPGTGGETLPKKSGLKAFRSGSRES